MSRAILFIIIIGALIAVLVAPFQGFFKGVSKKYNDETKGLNKMFKKWFK